MKTEKELFEEKYKELTGCDDFSLSKKKDGDYKFDGAYFGWLMWKASTNRDGYKLVPVCETCSGHGEVGCQFEGTFTCPDCIGDRLNFKAMIEATP